MIGWVDFIAGWAAGIAGLVVGHPLDTIKVRQQIMHTTLLDAIRKTLRHEGLFGLYKGILSPVMMTGPSNAVFFGVYGNIMRVLQDAEGKRLNKDDPEWKKKVFWAGCIAGTAQVMVTAPMELVKTMLQMQVQNRGIWETPINKFAYKRVVEKFLKKNPEPEYKGIWDCVKAIYKVKGVTGFYRGASPMLLRDVPTSGLYILVYEVLLDHEYSFDVLNSLLMKQTMAGGTAGIFSWIFVVPFDVIKSRLQADSLTDPKYKGMIDCFYKSYKADGLQIFMKGTMAVTVRAFPANAAIFVAYEYVFELLTNMRKSFS